ncbi:hypothetical protein GGI12_000441 [Dipsacomyces acuminosporus]|nr:hypothetical protein GGI12_000441 [Dipsacomyces acuminosporus]
MKTFAATLALAAVLATECVGFRFSAWADNGYTGQQFSTTGTGTFNLGFKARSYKWESPGGDGCCIKFCDGGRETGNWCPSHSNDNVAGGNQFNKVAIGCGGTTLNC